MIDLLVDSVSKRYRINNESGREDFWALRDVNFAVRRGESLGIIGHNGAGKSTMLKLLSNITTPTTGTITITGRLSALLEVGSGFHPELTGRENIYLSGSVLGMRRAEIAKKFDAIVEFSGVSEFIDLPVKRYSSGMYVRLGFSIAAHLDPDILLLDEVLAVGDRAFQQKCKDRILELHRQGMTIVFISHDLTSVRNICDRVLLMQRGKVVSDGSSADVLRLYTESSGFEPAPRLRTQERFVEVTSVRFLDHLGIQSTHFLTGYSLTCQLDFEARAVPEGFFLGVFFLNSAGQIASHFVAVIDARTTKHGPSSGTVEFLCPELGLEPGVYKVDVNAERATTREDLEWQYACATINVENGKETRGQFYMPHTWRRLEE